MLTCPVQPSDSLLKHLKNKNKQNTWFILETMTDSIPVPSLSLSQLTAEQLEKIRSVLDELLFDEWIGALPSLSTLQHAQVFITEQCVLFLEIPEGLSLPIISDHVQSLVESISQSACNVFESFLLTQALYINLMHFCTDYGSSDTDAALMAKQWAGDELSTEQLFPIEFLSTLTASLQNLCRAVFETKGQWPTVSQMLRWCALVLTEKSGAIQILGMEEDPCVTAMFAATQACMGNKLAIMLSSDIHSEKQTKEWSDFYKYFEISLNTNMKKTNVSYRDVYEMDIVYGTISDFVSDYLQYSIEGMETGNPQFSRQFIIEEQSLTSFHNLELSKLMDNDSLLCAAEVLQNLMGDIKNHTDLQRAKNLSHSTDTKDLQEFLAVLCNAVHLHKAGRKWWPRATQMISWCLLVLSDTGKLLEMGTGEGKSCVIAMFAVLRVLRGEKVDVVSSSSVLCQRDAKEWTNFYKYFGVTADTNTNKTTDEDRKECYQKDVVYGTIEAFAADHLRQIFEMKDVRPDRSYQCIIIDEVDSLLLDQGVQLTYLSSPMVSMQHLNIILAMIWGNVSQYGFLSTGHQSFVQGPPASFFKAIFDSIDTEETEINDPMDILHIAEELNTVPKGFTEELYRSEKEELLRKLKTALARARNAKASKEENALEAEHLRSVVADTLLKQPGQWEPFIKRKEWIEATRGGDWYLAEGGSDELLLDGDVLIPRTRNAMKCLKEPRACLWPKSANGNVEIPFLIREKYDQAERNTILTAMKDFASKTCIRFIPRTTQTRHISIEPRLGCFSLLGYVGGRQVVSLQKFGCVTHGITQHELLHSMGFYHEQSRSDRDHYVTINWDNIRTSYLSNFKKEDTNNLNTPYDYSSIMHYGRTAFGMHGSETITPFPNPSVPIGQRDRLSNFDILKINKLYKCWNYLCVPLSTALQKAELSNWKEKIVGFGSDGAAVMVGRVGGVTTLLRADVPHLINIQCLGHVLELAAMDAMKGNDRLKKLIPPFLFLKNTGLEMTLIRSMAAAGMPTNLRACSAEKYLQALRAYGRTTGATCMLCNRSCED
ncbi:Low choriolytic enzyme [Collichthys lucidus]|uniref:Metalloendopeptidase n=1 Tax=Collichthys lucidus TaxID=240159 RepID=A0A4U5TXJ4_COLLU|nr:Low choriolytic enzyme [Collichthys lucidus]